MAKKSVKEILPFAEKIRNNFYSYYKIFYKFDKDQVIKLSQDNLDMWKNYYQEKYNNRKLQGPILSIFGHLKSIGGFTFDIMELRIQMEY